MNERIRELAEQANAWYPMGYPSGEGGDAAWENLVIFEKEDLEKFAELIVRECAKIADDGFASSNFGNGITGHQLLKHFGVEE